MVRAMTDVDDLLLSEAELHALTGYRRPAEQLAELHRQGFSRARRNRLGRVVLERSHFEGVLAGNTMRAAVDVSGVALRFVDPGNGAKRAAALEQRTPPWADLAAIAQVYAEARRASAETGTPHHVDHEIPLQGRLVSGLHVANNLRVLPADENITKGNLFEVT
jgi:hypothetical protein